MRNTQSLGIRWTIGDISQRGYEALRLSVWGAWRLFGPNAAYTICLNTLPLEQAQTLAGELPQGIQWQLVTKDDLPSSIEPHIDRNMAEGVAWKLSPLRLFPDRYELSLDNDCILWDIPAAIHSWLEGDDPHRCVLAEDVRRCLGTFSGFCGPEPRNSGIRGLPPGLEYERLLIQLLGEHSIVLSSELDEQGLQTAALERTGPLLIVRVEEVSICSPFPPHLPHLGRCGAHFVGLNARMLPWSLEGRPATTYIAEHWDRHREELHERIGIPIESRVQT